MGLGKCKKSTYFLPRRTACRSSGICPNSPSVAIEGSFRSFSQSVADVPYILVCFVEWSMVLAVCVAVVARNENSPWEPCPPGAVDLCCWKSMVKLALLWAPGAVDLCCCTSMVKLALLWAPGAVHLCCWTSMVKLALLWNVDAFISCIRSQCSVALLMDHTPWL